MKKTALILMIITIISKIFGFARDLVLSYFYGASNISDAYLISLTIPMSIFGFIGTGIATGYTPLFSEIEQKYGEKEGNRFTSNLVNILIFACTILIIFGFVFTEPIVKIFAGGFEGETLALAIQFTKISLVGIYFTGLMYIFSGYLRLKGNYVVPELIGFPLNFITIIAIFLSAKTNILLLAIGSVIATASQLLLLVPSIKRKGYEHKNILDIKDKHIKKMVKIALPVIIGVSVNQINVLVDRTLASSIATGGITALNYANKLNGFVQGLFVSTIATAMYPMISKMAAKNNIKGLKRTVSESINIISLLVVPSTIGAMVFAEPIIRLLFGRGAFDLKALKLTSSALLFYSVGMVGFGFEVILKRAFYSLQDTKTPMINAALAVILNIILNIILSKYMGIGGLALATSISAIFCTGLLFISLKKRLGPFGMKNTIISFIKILFASLIMGVIAKVSYNLLLKNISANLSLITSIIIGVVVYFVMVCFMGIEEIETMVCVMKKKLKRINF